MIVAVEVSTTGFSSNLLVEEMSMDTSQILETLPEGETAGAGFIMAGPDSASASYGIEVLEQGRSNDQLSVKVYVPVQGAEYTPYTDDGLFPASHFRTVTDPDDIRRMRDGGSYPVPHHEATIALTRFLNKDKGTDAIVPLVPAATKELDEEIRVTVSKPKDVDGTAPDPYYTPTTPEGMVALAKHALVNLPDDHPLRERGITSLDQLSPDEIAVYGFGPVVGKPLVEDVLPMHNVNIDPDAPNVFKFRKDIERGLGELLLGKFSVVFTGYRAAGTMTKTASNTLIIDVGNAIDQHGVAMGNAHPNLVAESGTNGKIVSKFIGGAGRVTIALVLQRAAENKMENLRSAALPKPGLRDKVRVAVGSLFAKLPSVEQLN